MKGQGGGLTRRDLFKAAAGLGLAAFIGRAAEARAAGPGESPSILILGWDGADYRTVTNYAHLYPTLSALHLARLDCAGCTMTKPGWSELINGLDCDASGIFTNEKFRPLLLADILFYKLALAKPQYYGACIWSKRGNTGDQPGYPWHEMRGWALGGGLDYYKCAQFTNLSLEATWLHLQRAVYMCTHPGLVFCHYSYPDTTGHRSGADSKEYLQKMVKLDGQLGWAMELMQPDVVFVVSDHGFDGPGTFDHRNAPDGFIASNLPLTANCVRRDFGFTLHQLLGLQTEQPPLRGKSILA